MNDDKHEQRARDYLREALDATTKQMRIDWKREAIDEAGKIEDYERSRDLIDEIRHSIRAAEKAEAP